MLSATSFGDYQLHPIIITKVWLFEYAKKRNNKISPFKSIGRLLPANDVSPPLYIDFIVIHKSALFQGGQ